MRRIAAVGPNQLANAGRIRVDVVELVNDRVELGEPAGGVRRIQIRFSRTVERLITESRQDEGDEVLDPGPGDPYIRRLRHEPFGSPRELTRRAVAPEVIARLALRKSQAVAGREGSLCV